VNVKYNSGDSYYPLDGGKVFHMGYAQSSRIIGYKMQIHGHKAEIRPGWFENTFMLWKPGMGDVHPTNERGFWNPTKYEDDGKLLFLCGDHPYWNMEGIP